MKQRALVLLAVLLAVGLGYGWGHRRATLTTAARARMPLYYVDPMHPGYRSAKPGIAPDCGMQLVAVYAEDAGATLQSRSSAAGVVNIDGKARQLYGISLARVERNSGQNLIHAYGRVAADESRVYRVNMGTEGYVKETMKDAVGNHVTKNQHLAVVYSPEFLSVAGGYLSANERTPASNSMRENAAPTQNAAGAAARADRLRNLGMSDVQIEEISNTRKIPEDIYVVSPVDGFIVSREISAGMRFEKHTDFYRIADLSQVWVLADVFGKDVQSFRPGAVVRIRLAETGERFTGRVSSVLPGINGETRALQPRLEVANPGFHLRPGMFVDVEISAPLRDAMTVPVDAVVNTGTGKRVFVQREDGALEARPVELGMTYGEQVQIVRGVREGEMVVSSGTFLVDSESRMRLASGNGSGSPPVQIAVVSKQIH